MDRVTQGQSPTTMLDAAVKYALENIAVFPCKEKKPLTGAGGFKNATTDAAKIIEWWTKFPDAQIGVPTGELTHLFVIDVDGPEGQRAVEMMNLPETFTVSTRPGRFQLWFRQPHGMPSKCTTAVLGPQVDTRGDGGYVVAPPSIHHGTGHPYQVIKNLPWAAAPMEILEPKTNSASQQGTSGDSIPAGRRHSTMLSIAGALRARHLSPEMVLAQLRTVNERQCKPPLDDAELQKLAQYVGSKPGGFSAGKYNSKPVETSVAVETESFSGVTRENVVWLWKNRIAIGKLTLFVGEPGEGKSLSTIDVAARLSRGGQFPDQTACEIGDTLLLTAEDSAGDTIRPRLDAAKAVLSRVHRVKAVKVALADGETSESTFSLERDLERLEEAIKRIPDTRLVVIDPLSAYMGSVDTHRDAETRRVLTPLAKLADRLHIAIIAIMHLRKGEASAQQRVSGSVAFVAAARTIWGFGKETPDDPESRVMVPIKNNLAPLGEGLAYSIEVMNGVPYISWKQDRVTATANDILSGDKERSRRSAAREEATAWLVNQLSAGPRSSKDLEKQAKAYGISWRTIWRAKKTLAIETYPSPAGGWFWEMNATTTKPTP